MLSSPTAMGITGFTGLPSATHFSISPATCQGQAAVAVAAFAGILRRRPQAPGIICATQFARLQKTLNTASKTVEEVFIAVVFYSYFFITGMIEEIIHVAVFHSIEVSF